MPCLNCNSKLLEMNKKINLPVCKVCGQIQAYRIYEVTDTSMVTSRTNDEFELKMLLSEFGLQTFQTEIMKIYNACNSHLLFRKIDLATRNVAITTYTLRQLKQRNYPLEYCKFAGTTWKKVARLLKRIDKHFRTSGILTSDDLECFYDEVTEVEKENLIPIIKEWEEKETLTRGLLSALFYDNTVMTRDEARKLFGVSLPRLKRYLTKVRK